MKKKNKKEKPSVADNARWKKNKNLTASPQKIETKQRQKSKENLW